MLTYTCRLAARFRGELGSHEFVFIDGVVSTEPSKGEAIYSLPGTKETNIEHKHMSNQSIFPVSLPPYSAFLVQVLTTNYMYMSPPQGPKLLLMNSLAGSTSPSTRPNRKNSSSVLWN
jgi:hypothetical protein